MTLISRRDAGKTLLAGCAGALVPAGELFGAAKINSVVRGVQIGAQCYSFRDRPLDEAIAALREVGLSECETTDTHFSKPNTHGPNRDQWRLDGLNAKDNVGQVEAGAAAEACEVAVAS